MVALQMHRVEVVTWCIPVRGGCGPSPPSQSSLSVQSMTNLVYNAPNALIVVSCVHTGLFYV
jgi:hypothetical protein